MFVSVDKMSKKQKAEYNKSKRVLWDCSPVMKVVPNKKHYNRKKKDFSCVD